MITADMLKENYLHVLERIRAVDKHSSTRILAVSKTIETEVLREFLSLSLTNELGESRGQELRDKAKCLENACWHFIGPIQKNKVKYLKNASLIHSLSTIEAAEEISKKLNGASVLIQVNISGEEQKSGVSFEELPIFTEKCLEFENIEIKGLMAIASNTSNEKILRNQYSSLREAKEKLQSLFPSLSLSELSMGMSGDLEYAVMEGSTIVRIGSAIFGDRDYR